MNCKPIKYILGYHKIDLILPYALHNKENRKQVFQKFLFKNVTRPDLSRVPLKQSGTQVIGRGGGVTSPLPYCDT